MVCSRRKKGDPVKVDPRWTPRIRWLHYMVCCWPRVMSSELTNEAPLSFNEWKAHGSRNAN